MKQQPLLTETPVPFRTVCGGAEFSECRTYRYALWRIWGVGPCAMFIGLNPSTADENTNDPTIRRCIRFATDWGFGGLYMLNLFAYRSTDPKVLVSMGDPIGPKNSEALAYYRTKCELIVAAWGAHKLASRRGRSVCGIICRRLDCLGTTKDGSPRHPLYVRADVKPQLFWSPQP